MLKRISENEYPIKLKKYFPNEDKKVLNINNPQGNANQSCGYMASHI
jgi:hypothetical protein